MNDQDKLYYEKTTGSVNTTLTIIVKLFDILGIQGMKALIDPSFEETKTQIKLMRLAIDDYKKNIVKVLSLVGCILPNRLVLNIISFNSTVILRSTEE